MENPSKITPLHLLQVGVRKRRMPPMHGGWVTLQALEFEHRVTRGPRTRGDLDDLPEPWKMEKHGCGCRRNGARGLPQGFVKVGLKSVKVGESG